MRHRTMLSPLVLSLLLSPLGSLFASAELHRESPHYSIVIRLVEDPDGGTGKALIVETVNRKSGRTQLEKSPTASSELSDLLFPSDDRAVVHGKFRGEKGDVLTVIDLVKGSVIDTIYGWHASFSPSKTVVAYWFRYPPHANPANFTTVILAYDFTKSPQENSARQEDFRNPENRGYILYPNQNRQKGIYFIPASDEQEQLHLTSSIAWSARSDRFAFVEAQHGESFFVVVDLSQGLGRPIVKRQALDKQQFYKKLLPWRSEFVSAVVNAKELRFSADGQSVVIKSWAAGPFAEKEVVLRVN